MADETFDKIQELIQAVNRLHCLFNAENEKQMRVYNALHELKNQAEKESGRKIKY